MTMLDSGVRQRITVITDSFRSQLWPLPAVAVLLSLGLGVLLPRLDARFDANLSSSVSAYLFGGGSDAARTVLGAVAGSLVTLTSLTFSLTVVTLQLASGQFSPRLLRTFTSDRFVHRTLSLFLATFTYALTVLRTVRTETSGQAQFVPQLSVTVSFLLAVASVMGLVFFLAHLAREIRVETMLQRVSHDAETITARVLPARTGPVRTLQLPTPPSDAVPVLAPSTGFLTAVDTSVLLKGAQGSEVVLLLERPPGSWLVEGAPIGWAWPAGAVGAVQEQDLQSLQRAVRDALTTGPEPTATQDVSLGLKQLTDIACKALSPGINDPRTAIHALGHSAGLLCRLSQRELGPVLCADADDVPGRVYWDRPQLADLLDLAVSAPRRYGAADPDVLARLYALLAELAWTSGAPEHRTAVRGQLDRLAATVDRQELDGVERGRLHELDLQVRAALRGEHRSPARAVMD